MVYVNTYMYLRSTCYVHVYYRDRCTDVILDICRTYTNVYDDMI